MTTKEKLANLSIADLKAIRDYITHGQMIAHIGGNNPNYEISSVEEEINARIIDIFEPTEK